MAALLSAGELKPPRGYAVTPALREWYASGDIEELEYVALLHAARESLRLLAADPAAPSRRVVLAADLADNQVSSASSDAGEPGRIEMTGPVRLADIVSAHVDDLAASAEIAAAVAALAAADAGDDDARFAVDQAEGHELAWYATQELHDLSMHPD